MKEVYEKILSKTNGKSTTDIKNEMLKRPGESMANYIYPMIKAVWEGEEVPKEWNRGRITSIWKGKGAKELLKNHRGITTSSAIGTIVDALIDSRLESAVPLSQAQGGNKRGSSTCDHLLILRAIIDITKKKRQSTFITFYDVTKAYDNADNDDMLCIAWENSLRGKAWRILRNLNKNLTATVKTRYGLTREIKMEVGGRQGSRLTGRLFSKMMDTIMSELETTNLGFRLSNELKIPTLLWVDDVVTFVESADDQNEVLDKIDLFAKNHKLRWGGDKCQVLRIGKSNAGDEHCWKIGDMPISETDTYKYLGDVITSDGRNKKNIESRKNKLNATTITISAIASSEILYKIETSVLLRLHDSINLPCLLTNAESWTLNKSEQEEVERIEIQAIKNLFDLPSHMPTPAIIYTFGLLYTKQRIDQRQLNYLWRILKRHDGHWTKSTLFALEKLNIGWALGIKELLVKYGLETNFQQILRKKRSEWKRNVEEMIEKTNKERLLDECYKHSKDGIKTEKTKTKCIIAKIKSSGYKRKPIEEIYHCSKREAKTIMIARYGMLQCGKNFKGTLSETCHTCNILDDEEHRLNYCPKFKNVNNYNGSLKSDFNLIYSESIIELRKVIPDIMKVWNTKNANGSMNNE